MHRHEHDHHREAGWPHGHRPDDSGFWRREPLTAGDVMTTPVRAVAPGAPLVEIAAVMRAENVGVVPVVDDEHRLIGLVTDRDLVVRGVGAGRRATELRAADLMSGSVAAIGPHEPIGAALELMARQRVRRLPVVDERGHLVGIVSVADIASRADHDRELQHAFERISSRRSFWSR